MAVPDALLLSQHSIGLVEVHGESCREVLCSTVVFELYPLCRCQLYAQVGDKAFRRSHRIAGIDNESDVACRCRRICVRRISCPT